MSLTEEDDGINCLVKLRVSARLSFFSSESLLVFFIFFEVVIIPVFLIILLYGRQPEKVSAGYYALVYTGIFSIPFMYMVVRLEDWPDGVYMGSLSISILLGMFLVKSPLFFIHQWLPKAHVEAPTSGSILLAGLLLKVGIFGLMKITRYLNFYLYLVSLCSVVGYRVGACVASVSSETKVLAAYSSITHVNLVVYRLGILSVCANSGSYLVSLRHGYISTLLFYVVGTMYHYSGTRILYYRTGLTCFSGIVSTLVGLVLLRNSGTPPGIPFWGELVLVTSIRNTMFLVLATLFVYFMVGFYYRVFIIIHLVKTGLVVRFNLFVRVVCMLGLYARLNILVVLL